MSLKRKASFSAAPSSPFVPSPCDWDMIDNSKHLNSRTRKRFRDGRPSDEIVYEKTLRWIFSAQQQQQTIAPMDTCDKPIEDEEAPFTPETVDPRQHSLLRFFQPKTQPTLPFKPSREALAPRANETAIDQAEAVRRQAFERTNGTSSNGSEPISGTFNRIDAEMDTDMDIDMDTDQSSEGSHMGSGMGVVGWM